MKWNKKVVKQMELTAPIPYEAKIAQKDIKKVTLSHTVNRNKIKKEVYEATTGDPELILCVIHEFEDVASANNLNLNTGALKFSKFRECLSDQVRADWDRVRAGHELTEEGFEEAISEFIVVYLDEEALTEQKTYIAKAKKPYTMTVETFHSRLKRIVLMMMGYFPGAEVMNEGLIYNDTELKHIFRQAMPYPWQETFAKSGLNLSTMSWPRIERYFRGLKNVSDKNNGGNDKKRAARDDDDDHETSQSNGNGKRNNKWNNNKKNGKKQRFNGKGGGKNNKDGCPFHGSQHPWGKCFGNPESSNFKADYELPMPTGLRFCDKKVRFNGQTGRATGDAHAIDNTARRNNEADEHHHLDDFGEM